MGTLAQAPRRGLCIAVLLQSSCPGARGEAGQMPAACGATGLPLPAGCWRCLAAFVQAGLRVNQPRSAAV